MPKVQLPNLVHLGADRGVTGSCHLLRANGLNILIDCGSAQGNDFVEPIESWPIKPSEVDYIFITHAHIDHIGRIPELIRNGFSGEILTTHPTKILIMPMLEDSLKLSDMSNHEIMDLEKVISEMTWGFEYGQDFDLKNGIRFRLRKAGHILGSCFVRLESEDPPWSVIFSGDLGPGGKPLLPDPDVPDPCDLLVLESTYGDTIHDGGENRIEQLGAVLARALTENGKVFIPSFALGRTQELIHDLNRLSLAPEFKAKFPSLKPESSVPIFLDSPLAFKLTKIYTLLAPYWDGEARQILKNGDNPLDLKHLYAAVKYEDHLKLLEMPGPFVVLAGSGMCSGGRIVDHLKAGIDDPKNTIVFVGYQAEGTAGRDIIRFSEKPGGQVAFNGTSYLINAQVKILTGYSGHADQREIIHWVQSMLEKPGLIRLVHGENGAKQALGRELAKLGYNVG